jgi:excisionase family DNA binding protein
MSWNVLLLSTVINPKKEGNPLELIENKMYSLREAAKFLDLHFKTLERYITEGKVKAVKIGKRWKIKGAEIRRVMDEGFPEEEEPSEPNQANILIVDDDKEVLEALKHVFRFEEDCTIYTATSGKEALELMESRDIDVVIADQRMPKITGVELLSKVKELYPEVIRILITAYSDVKAAVDAINVAQVHRYISKPWNAGEIINVVKEALGLTSQQVYNNFS